MATSLTASDRKALIRLASTLPKGSKQRQAILAGLPKQASDDTNTYDITLTVSVTVPEDYDEDDRGDATEIARMAKDKMTSFLRGAKLWDFEVTGPDRAFNTSETERPASKRKASGGRTGAITYKDRRPWLLKTSEPYTTPEIFQKSPSPKAKSKEKAIAKVLLGGKLDEGYDMLHDYLMDDLGGRSATTREWVETMNRYLQKNDKASVKAMAEELMVHGLP